VLDYIYFIYFLYTYIANIFYVHKMSADNIKLICNNVEMFHKVWKT